MLDVHKIFLKKIKQDKTEYVGDGGSVWNGRWE